MNRRWERKKKELGREREREKGGVRPIKYDRRLGEICERTKLRDIFSTSSDIEAITLIFLQRSARIFIYLDREIAGLKLIPL